MTEINSTINSPLIDFFYQNSILQACDNISIAEEASKNQDLNMIQKAATGCYYAVANITKKIACTTILSPLADLIFDSSNETFTPVDSSYFLKVVLIAPLLEEMLFRGILQTSLYYCQELANNIAPLSLKETHVFIWLTSASCRVFIINGAFALLHLINIGYLSTATAVIQVTLILLHPLQSMLYETTGSLTAPIAGHITNNFIVVLLQSL